MTWTKKTLNLYGINLILRGLTIGSRFAFTIFLGKEFPEAVLGQYGLLSTTLLLFYFLLSFSFDSYGLREILTKSHDDQKGYIQSHFAFYGFSYLIFVPVVVTFFLFDFLPFDLLPYFLFLLLTETISQTFFALFTILEKSITANAILFFSQGFWILLVFLIWAINPKLLTFTVFLKSWIAGGLVAVIFSLWALIKIYGRFTLTKINWKWIRSGLTVSFLFFCSTISYKLIEFSDRYIIELHLGLSSVGIYAFYSQIANLINTVINVTVILILYPKLITYSIQKDYNKFLLTRKQMQVRVIGLGLVTAAVELFLISFLLEWLDKKSFEQEIMTFYILLASNIMMNLSFIQHYCLYALKKDRELLYTTLVGTTANIVSNLILIPIIGITGAAVSAFLSFSLIWLSKAFVLKNNLNLLQNAH